MLQFTNEPSRIPSGDTAADVRVAADHSRARLAQIETAEKAAQIIWDAAAALVALDRIPSSNPLNTCPSDAFEGLMDWHFNMTRTASNLRRGIGFERAQTPDISATPKRHMAEAA